MIVSLIKSKKDANLGGWPFKYLFRNSFEMLVGYQIRRHFE